MVVNEHPCSCRQQVLAQTQSKPPPIIHVIRRGNTSNMSVCQPDLPAAAGTPLSGIRALLQRSNPKRKKHGGPCNGNSKSNGGSKNNSHHSRWSLHGSHKQAKAVLSQFVVRRSRIAGQGVYTTQAISKGTLLLEYMGEVVRQSVADIRERAYQQCGLGTYFFAMSTELSVDATWKGNIARFINHCCRCGKV